jgi:hypothetical protein
LRKKGEIPFRTSIDLQAGRSATVEYAFAPRVERSLLLRFRDWVLR